MSADYDPDVCAPARFKRGEPVILVHPKMVAVVRSSGMLEEERGPDGMIGWTSVENVRVRVLVSPAPKEGNKPS